MRRFFRIALNALTVLSLALAVGVAGLWVITNDPIGGRLGGPTGWAYSNLQARGAGEG